MPKCSAIRGPQGLRTVPGQSCVPCFLPQATSPHQSQHSTVDVGQLHDPQTYTQHAIQVQHIQVAESSPAAPSSSQVAWAFPARKCHTLMRTSERPTEAPEGYLWVLEGNFQLASENWKQLSEASADHSEACQGGLQLGVIWKRPLGPPTAPLASSAGCSGSQGGKYWAQLASSRQRTGVISSLSPFSRWEVSP